MSISIPGADYTPQLVGYTGQGAFRFWCQKVLPIVYDDSLSYYELLNKVVNYLNNVIADVASVENNIGELNESYISLQNYVNEHMQEIVDVVNEYTEFTTNYFNNLDVQEEINAKLDEMASDGSLSRLIVPIVGTTAPDIITQWMNEHITPTTPIVDDTLTISGAAADAKVTGDKIGVFERDLYRKTDNLIRFDDESFWQRKNLDLAANVYSLVTTDMIPVTGGSELYTALRDLPVDTLGTQFNIKVREYAADDSILVNSQTFSTITSTNPVHYTLNANTAKIRVMLTTNNYNKIITPAMFKEMNPVIYVGFNSEITNATAYRMYTLRVEFLEEEYNAFSKSVNATLGTVNYVDFEYLPDRFIAANGNIAVDTSEQHAVLVKGLKANEGDEFVVYCETPKTGGQQYLIYCAYSSITDLRSATAIGGRVGTTDVFIDTGTTYITKIEFTVPSGAKTVAFSFRTFNDAKWIILRKSNDPLKNSQLLNIHNILMDAYAMAISSGNIDNISAVKAINHRGYNSIAPENTLPAFKLSRKKGFKYVETDVRFTSDGVAVLLHDATINRTARNADGTELSSDVYIDAITYQQALTYDFGVWKSPTYAETRIPTFEQFVALCRNIGVSAYVEIKAGTQAQVESLVDIGVKYGMEKHITWNSFEIPWLEYIKNYKPNARIGLLANTIGSDIISSANGLKTDLNEVFINASVSTITEANVSLAIANNLPVEAWTVYTSDLQTLNPYVTGMTTDQTLLNNYMYTQNID